MKKIKYLFLLILCMPFVALASTGSYGMDYSSCASGSISKYSSGQFEVKYCYRAACSSSTGTVNYASMTSAGYTCSNGNKDPYVKTSDGCSKVKINCKELEYAYCTVYKTVDCSKKSNGQAYSGGSTPTTTTTTKAPQTVTTKTTKANTTTTSRKSNSGTTRTIISTTKNL